MPPPSPQDRLVPDCAACAALCCIALDLPRGDRFAIDKPAGTPCPNLDGGHRCRIHPLLARRGFAGCSAYDCLGAGQRVTRDLYGGESWRDRPELLDGMIEDFARLRRLHRLLELLVTAARLPLSDEDETTRRALVDEIAPPEWTRAALAACLASGIEARARAFLAGLATPSLAARAPRP